jgi:phosphate transport system protein
MYFTLKNILFVCIENSNRSQMAQAFAKIHGKGRVNAFSAGSKPSGKINPKAVEAMMEKGYDLTTHKSKSLEELPNEKFDFVITMGCGDECPFIPARQHLDWQIHDPDKMDREEFRKVRDLIESKVTELITKNIIMTHLDEELIRLKNEIIEMWNLVILQLKKTQEALVIYNKDKAHEVIADEKRVNAMELKIDRDCENIFALFNPLAVDLRFVLAILKINSNLERTGDIAEGIAKFIVNAPGEFDEQLLALTEILRMYEEANDMLEDVLNAFTNEDTKLARTIFKRDEMLDEINRKADSAVAGFIRTNPDKIEQGLYILSTIRKLERVGDQSKNIAEEIIFYCEAKVLKHSTSKTS